MKTAMNLLVRDQAEDLMFPLGLLSSQDELRDVITLG
jgi:hypothetical protein